MNWKWGRNPSTEEATVKQVEEFPVEFKAEVLVPQEQADIRFSDSLPELTQTWQHFGKVYFSQAFGAMQ